MMCWVTIELSWFIDHFIQAYKEKNNNVTSQLISAYAKRRSSDMIDQPTTRLTEQTYATWSDAAQ